MNLLSNFTQCRDNIFDKTSNRFLISRIASSEQEPDLSKPPNCDGYGRIRHFRRFIADDWCPDPLPLDPCTKALKLDNLNMLEAQVFQIASCNLNCWYCFVPDTLKIAKPDQSKWFSCDEMIRLFNAEKSNIRIIDLSGGNPELVPEWVLYTMKALEKMNLNNSIYLWSDDTLTTDFTFKYLKSSDLLYMKRYLNYGKVCCFKGYDQNSFSFNTLLPSSSFDNQFDLFARYMELRLDLFGYVTFTTNNIVNCEEKIDQFITRLIQIHPLLPLRIIPLKIVKFSSMQKRMKPEYEQALINQLIIYNEWARVLSKLYNPELLNVNISNIQLY